MAIALIRNSGQVATTAPIGGGAVALPITAGAVNNNWVVVVVTSGSAGATSLSDSAGTTYQLDAEVKSGVTVTVQVWSAKITSGAVTSISVNGLTTVVVVEAAAYEFSGFRTSSWVDTTGSGTGVGSATSAGPTAGNLEPSGDAAFAAFGSTATLGTFSAGGEYVAGTGADQTGGSSGAEYLLTPTGSSKATATGSFSVSGTWAGLIVAYQAAPVAATTTLNASGGSSGGSFAPTAPTKVALSASIGTSEGSTSATAPTQIGQSAAVGSSGTTLAVSAPTQIALRSAAGQSEAGAPGIEPSEELEPGEELYPGQEDLPLTAPSRIQLAAGSSSSASTMGVMTIAPLSLAPSIGLSTGGLQDTATALLTLSPAVGISEAGTRLYPSEELQPGEVFPGLQDLQLTVPTQPGPSLVANATSGGSLRIVALSILTHPGLIEPRELAGLVSPAARTGGTE